MFSWLAFFFNAVLVLFGAFISFAEGRLTHRQLGPRSIPWTRHGGNWADLILVSIIAGLVWPYSAQWSSAAFTRCALVSAAISFACHVAWGNMQLIPGSIVDPFNYGWRRLPFGGWYHLLYMWWTLSWILLFFLYTPGADRLAVCLLFTIFIIPAIMQPGWYASLVINGKGRIDDAGGMISIALWALIWFLGYTRA